MSCQNNSLSEQRDGRSAAPRPGRGRPRLQIDGVAVHRLAAIGLSDMEIAEALGCSAKTLRRRFRDQLRLGRARISGSIKIELVRRALYEDDRRALLLLAKRLNWDK